MLNLQWPIQYHSQQFAYVFMLLVCHHLYLLRVHASRPQQVIVFSLFLRLLLTLFRALSFQQIPFCCRSRNEDNAFIFYLFVIFFFIILVAMLLQTLQNVLISVRNKVKQICVCLSNTVLKGHNHILQARGESF